MGLERLGRFTLRWDEDCFPLGQDSLFLAAFATLSRGYRVCDLGCGAGAILLALLEREPSLQVTGVERCAGAAAWARRNLEENGCAGEIITYDICRIPDRLPAGGFDLVVSNPPYFTAKSGRPGGTARMEETCDAAALCRGAGWLLKNGGRAALCIRPERLAEWMGALRARGMEPKRLQLVQHNERTPPSLALLEGVRQGRPGLAVLPTRILHKGDG